MRSTIIVAALLLLLNACSNIELAGQEKVPQQTAVIVQPSPTPSSTPTAMAPTPAATNQPTATPLPTATATATPTAEPISVSGSPRAAALEVPPADNGPICGVADLFDFPLEAPHAASSARGGTDFGIYRSRYDKYHAGEDWWISGGRSSLGAPVYSIGHGRVTYAEPLGWGRDQGVIIVRHTFRDGHQILSFYGHLDPESFEVRSGDCVRRGDLIGKIGKPKTGPHLHFEMRTHMPLETGTGYWPEDPTLAGWRPPSATIWDSRMALSPGVYWTQPFTAGFQVVGLLGDELIIIKDGAHVIGLQTTDGVERWRLTLGDDVEQVLLNNDDQLIYAANQFGQISAYLLPDAASSANKVESMPLWMVDSDAVGIPELLPLPGGGAILSSWDTLHAVSEDGKMLWQEDLGTRPYDWQTIGDSLIISSAASAGSLWTADVGGLQTWEVDAGGRLAAVSGNLLLYNGSDLFRLNPETRKADLMINLPGGSLQLGDVTALAEGGALLVHADHFDRRLVAVDADGLILWQKSIAELPVDSQMLFTVNNELYLVLHTSSGSGSEVSLYDIDLMDARLTYLFNGGNRNNPVQQTGLYDLGQDRILLNIDGRSLTALDPGEAEQIVSAGDSSSR